MLMEKMITCAYTSHMDCSALNQQILEKSVALNINKLCVTFYGRSVDPSEVVCAFFRVICELALRVHLLVDKCVFHRNSRYVIYPLVWTAITQKLLVSCTCFYP
jgi:hypothetical protein